MHEVETKILNVDSGQIAKKLEGFGAEKIQDTKLCVDWFKVKGQPDSEVQWYLRIRSYSDGKSEVTWKGKSDKLGVSRKHKEINFVTGEPEKLAELFGEIGLEKYASQEKYRKSWQFKDWRFDLDQYPNMPAYLEIEGKDEVHIQAAIEMLDLGSHKASPEGEKLLIENEYGLNWHSMKF